MANFNLNKVILGGRLTADPELKTTQSGVSVTTFTLAVSRRFGGKEGEPPQADFINVTAWRQTAVDFAVCEKKECALLRQCAHYIYNCRIEIYPLHLS